jgi:hypothetical protein
MTRDAPSHRFSGARAQKPTPLKTSPRSVICALALLGCGTTPIDAVTADLPAPDNGPVNPPSGSAACSEPTAGRFTLSLQSACWRRGEPTTVFGAAAFSTELTADCTSARAQWDLTPALEGTFTLRNVDDQLSLDVRAASDLPGTPIIVFDPNTLDNQRFWFRPRASRMYELAPRHAPTLCAEGRGSEVEIWPCDTNNPAQAFRFARVSCP